VWIVAQKIGPHTSGGIDNGILGYLLC